MRALVPIVAVLLFGVFAASAADASTVRYVAQENRQERTWNFEQATIPGAQPQGDWGEGVTVAVIDTWVDYTHPDLKGRIAGRALCIDSESGCEDKEHRADRCEHGTHVAGTVVSGRYGVAPQARVYAVQVLAYDSARNSCTGASDDVARGIGFAVAKGVDVINLSLGTLVPGVFSSEAVAAAVEHAARAGVVVVFAAGNSTVPISEDYGSDAVIVAATGPDGEIASYSTRGGSVSLAAPGGDDGAAGLTACSPRTCVKSTVPGGSYALLEGTSMAAPHVSGAAALLLSQHPDRGREDVLRSLQSTARPLAGTRHGLIDATAALALRKRDAAPTTTSASGTEPNGALRQRTEQPRPPRQSPPPGADAGSDPRPGDSRSVTFSRDPAPDGGDRAASPKTTDEAAPVGPPASGPPGGSTNSGLPLKAIWSGLAAVGVMTAVLAVVGATQRFRRSRYEP
ncbi:S8 family peptidase [Haloechinothrix salitolerans]|uniref:S8 family serine peptidase n=1 Tax=Haloechinothrix salitolerans TaxID=926830 RepID=A0ABW2BV47_9PSEU